MKLDELVANDKRIFDNILRMTYGVRHGDLLYNWEWDTFRVIRNIEQVGMCVNVYELNEMANTRKSAQLDDLRHYIKSNGKVHTNIDQFSMITGKLQTSDYNFMDMPYDFRSLFVPPQGRQFASFRFDNIRLYVLAYLAEDENLLSLLKEYRGNAVYTALAHKILPYCTDNCAISAYAFMQAFIMGNSEDCTGILLANNVKNIKEVTNRFMDNFIKLVEFKHRVIEETLTSGYINSHFGRQWYVDRNLPDIAGTIFNYVTQSTAQDLMHCLISHLLHSHIEISMVMNNGLLCSVPLDFIADIVPPISFDGFSPTLVITRGWNDGGDGYL